MRPALSELQKSILILIATLWMAGYGALQAADLQPDTLNAWAAGVNKLERRMSAELSSEKGFLALDFQDPAAAAEERKQILSGKIPIKQIRGSEDGPSVPKGMLHHWRGTVFIPGVPLDFVMAHVENPRPEDSTQEDVLESRVIEKSPGQLKLYLKLQRSKIVTVVYNTEHLVRYRRYGSAQATSSSIATRIAEIENFGERNEREKPEGHDHGYLWRMNSYWRYQEVKGGIIVECESITLSRAIPSLLEYMVQPIIKSVARESMRRTLESLRSRMIRNYRMEREAHNAQPPAQPVL